MISQHECGHQNKIVTDCENMDGEVYCECPDCNAGWRQLPETEEDVKTSEKIMQLDINTVFGGEQR